MIVPQPGVVIAGRYTLVRPLARGGMGSVWIAHHRDLEVDVTVKFMAPSLVASPDARLRFEREAKGAARIRSQHVVQVHDYGVEDETPYIVMELLKGESLWTRLAREGRLPLPVTARLLVQICKALRTAHEAGLVHRDLKPGNIFLALKDDDEVVTVLDFGIAKTSGIGDATADTDSGVLLGSVHYMSPEQIRNSRKVDLRSDLWAIGVILYRTLAGRLPFPGENVGDVLVRVCTDPWPAPSTICSDLPSRVDAFFERALARDPERRFQSAPEMAEAFSAMALEADAPASSAAPAPPFVATPPAAPAPPASQPPPWSQVAPASAPAPREAGTMRMSSATAAQAAPAFAPQRAASSPSIAPAEPIVPATAPAPPTFAPPTPSAGGRSLHGTLIPARSAVAQPAPSPFAQAAPPQPAQPTQSTFAPSTLAQASRDTFSPSTPAPQSNLARSSFDELPQSTFGQSTLAPAPQSTFAPPPQSTPALSMPIPSARPGSSPMLAPPSERPSRVPASETLPKRSSSRTVGLALAATAILGVLGAAIHFSGTSRSAATASTAPPPAATPAPPSATAAPPAATLAPTASATSEAERATPPTPSATALSSAPEPRAPEPPKRAPTAPTGAPAKPPSKPRNNLLDRAD
ncbi:Putative serine/threonine-protein kinase pknH [Minicystis rosea]|nr:Putative serine/threonine-protein kinase pknH [Minicystis rosea]